MLEFVAPLPILLAIAMIVLLAQSIRVASEYQRFAVFVVGRFGGFRGPGLLLKIPGSANKWVRLSVGDEGTLMGPDVARFGQCDIPVSSKEKIRLGSLVRIVGFSETVAEISASAKNSENAV